MEELFTIILLTLINVIEIIYMITGSLLPLAAILIFFILILVFMAVFMMRRKLFWKFALLAFIINLLNLGYMFLRAGMANALYLALFINIAGILFVIIQPKRKPLRKAIPISSCARFSQMEDVCDRTEPAPSQEQQSANHIHFVEEFIRQLEEKAQAQQAEENAFSQKKADAEKEIAEKTAAETAPAKSAPAKKAAVKKRFSPGKFVASKTGRQYHKPRCDWANNIKKQNRIWFASEKEAEKKGLTAHWCLKKK
jgi:hypothetical protein